MIFFVEKVNNDNAKSPDPADFSPLQVAVQKNTQ